MILDLFIYIIQFYINQNTFLPGFIIRKEHVIVRTPLIPTMTASFENISSISRFLVSCYEDVHYEILNYNPLAQSKYAYLDMEYCFKENPKMYSSEKMQEFYDCAKQNGIKNLVID